MNVQPHNGSVKRAGVATFSLWLAPAGRARDDLAHIIAALAGRFGTRTFEPHITLVSGLTGGEREVERAARELVRRVAPISIRLGPVGFEDQYFRCCYLVAEGDRLLAARRLAEAIFALEPATYAPHLSLLYGTLRADVQETLRSEIEGMLPLAFDARTLEVWQTTGEVDLWKRIATFGLAAGP